MKHFITLTIIAIIIAPLAQPATARDIKGTERTVDIIRNWGSDYDAPLAQPATARDIKGTERTVDIIRNWGGEYD